MIDPTNERHQEELDELRAENEYYEGVNDAYDEGYLQEE